MSPYSPSGLGDQFIVENRLVFTWNGKFWSSDGTAEGTREGVDISAFQRITATSDRLFLIRDDDTLWVSDGTAQGTRKVKTITGGPRKVNIEFAGAWRNLVFVADVYNDRLWRSDGTEEGTYPLESLNAPKSFIDAGAYAALVYDGSTGHDSAEVWRTDGTAAGTALVRTVGSSSITLPRPFRAADGQAYMLMGGPTVQLLNLSGGHDLATALPQFENGEGAANAVAAGQNIFFAATTERYGSELFSMRLDGKSSYRNPVVSVRYTGLTTTDGGTRKAAVFLVAADGIFSVNGSVTFMTSGESAAEGRDFVRTTTTLQLNAKLPRQWIVVPLADDAKGTFYGTLWEPQNVTIDGGIARAVIIDEGRRRSVRH